MPDFCVLSFSMYLRASGHNLDFLHRIVSVTVFSVVSSFFTYLRNMFIVLMESVDLALKNYQNILFIFYALIPLMPLIPVSIRTFNLLLQNRNSVVAPHPTDNMATNWERKTDEGNEGHEDQKKWSHPLTVKASRFSINVLHAITIKAQESGWCPLSGIVKQFLKKRTALLGLGWVLDQLPFP